MKFFLYDRERDFITESEVVEILMYFYAETTSINDNVFSSAIHDIEMVLLKKKYMWNKKVLWWNHWVSDLWVFVRYFHLDGVEGHVYT